MSDIREQRWQKQIDRGLYSGQKFYFYAVTTSSVIAAGGRRVMQRHREFLISNGFACSAIAEDVSKSKVYIEFTVLSLPVAALA